MKSHIYITPVIDNKAVPAAPDNSVLLSSEDKWKGIKVEHHILQPAQLPEHVVQEHRLTINIGMPLSFEWKKGNKWQKGYYETGAFTMLSHGEVHTPKWSDHFNFIAIALSPRYMDELIDTPNFSFSEQRLITDKQIHQLSLALLKELKQNSLAGKIYGESVSMAFALHLAEHYATTNKKLFQLKGKLSAAHLCRVVDYVRTFSDKNIGLNELAEQINSSPFHFARLFKQTLGISPHQYVLQLKIEQSKQLIKQSSLSFTEIAYRLGFADQAHFTNAFKKASGISPRQFRNS